MPADDAGIGSPWHDSSSSGFGSKQLALSRSIKALVAAGERQHHLARRAAVRKLVAPCDSMPARRCIVTRRSALHCPSLPLVGGGRSPCARHLPTAREVATLGDHATGVDGTVMCSASAPAQPASQPCRPAEQMRALPTTARSGSLCRAARPALFSAHPSLQTPRSRAPPCSAFASCTTSDLMAAI